MILTKRSTTLLAVFCIGLVALVVDRTILRPQGGPRAASAASEFADSGLLSSNVPILDARPPEQGMAQQLDSLSSGQEPDFGQMRNPFALTATWLQASNVAGEPVPDATTRFIRTHQLTAVVINGQGSYALVNDRLLPPGGTLDGFTLVEVRDRAAIFEREKEQALLELINR